MGDGGLALVANLALSLLVKNPATVACVHTISVRTTCCPRVQVFVAVDVVVVVVELFVFLL